MLSQKHQHKFDLLLHLIRNSELPITLMGSEPEQTLFKTQLEQETSTFQSISVFQADDQSGAPQLIGLLLHQLGISEQAVINTDPEALLTHYLGALKKRHQLLLVIIEKVSIINDQHLSQILSLAQSYSALRLVFVPNRADPEKWKKPELHLFFVSHPKQVPIAGKITNTTLKLGGLLSLLLLFVLVGIIWFPQELEQNKNAQQMLITAPPETTLLSKKSEPVINTVSTNKPIITFLEKDDSPTKQPIHSKEQTKKITNTPVTKELITSSSIKDAVLPTKTKGKTAPEKQTRLQKVEIKKPPLITSEANKKIKRITAVFLPAVKSTNNITTKSIHKESWLLKQSAEMYTLQTMGGSEEKAIIQYIRNQPSKNLFSYYHSTRKGKSWFPVLYGVYPSKNAAKKATKKLPLSLLKFKPWARSLKSIQKEIHDNR